MIFQLTIGRKYINAIAAISMEGIEDVYLSEENVSCEDFVRTTLLPSLMPLNQIVILCHNFSNGHLKKSYYNCRPYCISDSRVKSFYYAII